MIDSYNKVAHSNPFPGLRSFDLEDSSLFFGRDSQIAELKQKLARSRFLAIIGSSGSGKSSVVKAGLIPQLTASQATGAQQEWKVAYFTPEATPIRNLALALHQTFSLHNRAFSVAYPPEEIERLLLTSPATVIEWCAETNLLIFIDQFEELFRYQQEQRSRREVAQFVSLLLNFSRHPNYPVYVVLTMRSDYLDECTDYEGLTDAINHGSYLLPKMNRAEIEQAITAPVAIMGASISPKLTARLLSDIGDKADHLPILQHALMRTWNYWQFNRKQGQPLDEADYEAIGTMEKAITQHAEEVYGDLPDEKSRVATEKLFKALIVLGAGNTGVIHPLPVREISEIAGVNPDLLVDILNRFREPDMAFLTPSTATPATEQLIVDIGHERIMNLWERLSAWVREETESARFYKQLSNSAALYHDGKSGIWNNPELQIGLKWLADNHPTQAWANRYDPHLDRAVNFLTYSKKQFDFELESKELRQKKELRRTRAFAIFLGIGSLISLLFLIISAVLRTQAQQSEDQALAEKKNALFERNRAEAQTREAITQKKIAEQQEIITGQQKEMTEEQRVLAVGAQRVAVEKQKEAEAAQQRAEKAQQYAEEQRQNALAASEQAVAASKDARRQEGIAKGAQKDAEDQRSKAVTAQGYAEQQRGKAIARTVAIQSFQMTDNGQDDLPALLAVEAYNLNQKSGGQVDNPDVFNALAKASKSRGVLRGHADYVRTVVQAPGAGSTLASGSDDGTVRLWSYTNLTQPAVVLGTPNKNADGIRSLAFEDEGHTIAGGSEKGRIYLWNTSTPTAMPVAVAGHKVPVRALLKTADEKMLLSVSGDGELRSWRLSPGRLDSVQNVRSGQAIFCAQLTPDNQRLVCGSDNGRILSFDLADLKKKPEIIEHREFGDRVTALAFSPDGKQLVTGNSAGTLYAWELTNNVPGDFGQVLSGRHNSSVSDIAFSPNGLLLASCSPDWTIHIWNYSSIATQQQPIILADFGAWVMSVRFSNDNKRIIASGADKTVRIRAIDTADLYAELVKKLKRNLSVEEWNKYIGKDIQYEKLKPE
ncbi:nSTAND1 domain-containing NTPase [Hymenobacter rubidus]|uniref:nSTAND1 domain-containing NTPase n=1 Tax=Hymenobacter rubidus TaxID=1441626 RepID=UPI00191DFFA0|nr:hypothetical protein [Hymenobacter rubidus]